MWTADFWKATLERAIKTFAQAVVALFGAGAVGLFDADWTGALSVGGMAAVVSVLTSVGSAAATGGGPSLTNSEVPADTVTEPDGPKHSAG